MNRAQARHVRAMFLKVKTHVEFMLREATVFSELSDDTARQVPVERIDEVWSVLSNAATNIKHVYRDMHHLLQDMAPDPGELIEVKDGDELRKVIRDFHSQTNTEEE